MAPFYNYIFLGFQKTLHSSVTRCVYAAFLAPVHLTAAQYSTQIPVMTSTW